MSSYPENKSGIYQFLDNMTLPGQGKLALSSVRQLSHHFGINSSTLFKSAAQKVFFLQLLGFVTIWFWSPGMDFIMASQPPITILAFITPSSTVKTSAYLGFSLIGAGLFYLRYSFTL